MNVKDAIASPRVSFVQPDTLVIEEAIALATVKALRIMGHNVKTYARLGNAHGLTIQRDNAGKIIGFSGAADPRGNGSARGY